MKNYSTLLMVFCLLGTVVSGSADTKKDALTYSPALAPLSGCGSADTKKDALTYKCVIPEGLPKAYIQPYPGTDEVDEFDGHEMYKKYHKMGWNAVIRDYLKTQKLDLQPAWPFEHASPMSGVWNEFWRVGVIEAQAMLLKRKLVLNHRELHKRVRLLYPEVAKPKK